MKPIHAAFSVVMSLVVVSTIAWGFVLVGSPISRRLERFDERRLEDLQTIAREVQSMVVSLEDKGELSQPLPATLAEAAEKATYQRINLRDPQTDEPYVYTVKDETTFELCATFSRPRDVGHAVFWNHPAGTHCFTINVLNPPRPL